MNPQPLDPVGRQRHIVIASPRPPQVGRSQEVTEDRLVTKAGFFPFVHATDLHVKESS